MAAQEDVTDVLKAKDQMRWTELMNNIHNCAMEIVKQKLIYE